ncbi:MAG: hypothetical protein EAY75_02350 [Bacteroidetes bacterium]|nr:MAG: hypothetical protein EAY75_02350 [Bacteroidota bacterium]
MLPHHTNLEKLLKQKSKATLIQTIINIYERCNEKAIWDMFGDLIYEHHYMRLTPLQLRRDIETFYQKSVSGEYYAPFAMDSKNFMHIPDKTECWFNEIALLLDLCCELVLKNEPTPLHFYFHNLFDLIKKMEAGEEIIFAHECDTDMICCKHDYKKIYREYMNKQQ